MQQLNNKNTLILIPKAERYIQYMVETIMKLSRTEKFSIGNEYKLSMYRMLELILYIDECYIGKNSFEFGWITDENDEVDYIINTFPLEQADVDSLSAAG